MSAVEIDAQSVEYVDFWNEVLVPKFIKYKHILVDGLTHHSEAIFPSLQVSSPLKMSVSVSTLRQDNDRQADRHIASQRRYQQHSQATGG